MDRVMERVEHRPPRMSDPRARARSATGFGDAGHDDRRAHERAFAAAAGVVVALLAVSNAPTPLLPVFQRHYGLTPFGVTLVYSTYALAVMVGLVLIGSASDVLGRRRMLLVALAGSTISTLVFASAHVVALLFVAQVIEGFSMAALQGASVPALAETEPDGDPARAARVAVLATVGGAALGPLVVGALAEHLPWPERLPFLVAAVALVGVGAWVATRFPRDRRSGTRWRPARPQVPDHIRGTFVVTAVTAFFVWAVASLFLSVIPSYVVDAMGTRDLLIVGLAAASMLGSSALAQITLARRMAPVPAQRLGLLVVAVAAIGLVLSAPLHATVAVLVAAAVGGFGHGLAFNGATTTVNEIAPPDRRADVVAAYFLVVYLGTSVPVIGVGLLADHLGLASAVQVFAIVAAIGSVAVAAGAFSGGRVGAGRASARSPRG